MTFTLSVFDLFSYAIPGSLHLSLLSYLAVRLDWLDLADLSAVPGVLLLAGAAIASYLLGHLTYPLSTLLDRRLPRRRAADARAVFLSRLPAAAGRPYLEVFPHLLLAGVELRDRDVAIEVSRLRAAGLMVRNSALPLAVAALVAAAETVVGPHRGLAVGCLVLFALATVAAQRHGRELRHWANVKTLEICYWLPDLDAALPPRAQPPG